MPTKDIFWVGQIVEDEFHPDTTLTHPKIKNNTTGEFFTAVHIGNGAYMVKNIPNGNYTFYDGDDIKPTIFGDGTEGFKHYFDGNVDGSDIKSGTIDKARLPALAGEDIVSGTINKDRLPNDIPESKISGLTSDLSSLNTAVAGKAGLATNNDFTGPNTFEQMITVRAPISTDYADPELDSAPENLVTNARLEYKIANYQGYAESPNFVRVAPGVTPQPGKVYSVLSLAVQSFPGASVSKICKVYVQGMNATTYITALSGAMRSYVNIIAADRSVVISFPHVNTSEKVTIENATVVLGGGALNGGSASARIWTNVNFINCKIYHFKNFTLKGGLLENCTVISPDTCKVIVDKDGSNIYTDIINTVFRVNPEITDESTYQGAVNFSVIPALKTIEDFTSDLNT